MQITDLEEAGEKLSERDCTVSSVGACVKVFEERSLKNWYQFQFNDLLKTSRINSDGIYFLVIFRLEPPNCKLISEQVFGKNVERNWKADSNL